MNGKENFNILEAGCHSSLEYEPIPSQIVFSEKNSLLNTLGIYYVVHSFYFIPKIKKKICYFSDLIS